MNKNKIKNKNKIRDIIIIGGGPAGLASALYASRAGFSPLVFAGSPSGGQLTLTSEVENYLGFESILGPELIKKMREHAGKFGAEIIDENVKQVDFSERPFKIYSSSLKDKPFLAQEVIIATGAKAMWLGLESEERLRGKGVSACATCDGFFFRDKRVAVVGGGDTALEEAMTLTKFAKKVYIIHRRDQFRASKIMQERVFKNPKIKIIWNSSVDEVLGKEKVEGVRLKIKGQELKSLTKELKLDGLFIAIGHKPDTELFKGQLMLDSKGYIITAERYAIEVVKSQIPNSKDFRNWKLKIENYRSATSVDGVFASGDCVDYIYRQAGTAVGMGIASALDAGRWLENNN